MPSENHVQVSRQLEALIGVPDGDDDARGIGIRTIKDIGRERLTIGDVALAPACRLEITIRRRAPRGVALTAAGVRGIA